MDNCGDFKRFCGVWKLHFLALGEVGVDCGEAGEVMFTKNLGRRALREVEVEGPWTVPDIRRDHGGADAVGLRPTFGDARENPIFVRFSDGAMASVEILGSMLGRQNPNGRGQRAIQRPEQIGWRDGRVQRKARHLTERVDTRVGASGALRKHRFASDVVDSSGDRPLNRGERRLNLPAVEVSAVVRKSEFP